LEKETSLPGGGSLRDAVSVETAARTEIKGGPPAWDYSHARKRRLIRVTPTLLGEEKPPFQTRRSRVVRRLLSWLIDALVRAGQRRQYLSSS
jgi:hypothetical protein